MDIKILGRVRALLAKAESTTYPEEAEAFTAKAMELMATHGITDAMLAAAGEKEDPIGAGNIKLSDPYSFEKSQLLSSICDALRCRVVFGTLGRRVLYCDVTGYQSDRERAELLFTSLLLQATKQVMYIHPKHSLTDWADYSSSKVAQYRRSWWAGFSYQVQVRLVEAERKATSDYDTKHESNGAELVLVDRKAQVDRYFEQHHPDLEEMENGHRVDPFAFAKGMQAGNRADLGNGGLGSSPIDTAALPS